MKVGIEFGTTHAVAAVVDRDNYAVASFEGVDTWPSVIAANAAGYALSDRLSRHLGVFRISITRRISRADPSTVGRTHPISRSATSSRRVERWR